MTKQLLRQYIAEVLTGFGNKSRGRDNPAGNMFPTGVSTGDAGVRGRNDNILADEREEEENENQDIPQAACCLIRSKDGKILSVSRRDDPTDLGMPGGKVDPGEDPEQAAKRELEEETGLVATKLTQVFKEKDSQGFITTTFACQVDGEIDTEESGVIRWVEPEEMTDESTCQFAAYNSRLFNHLGIIDIVPQGE